MIWTRRIVDVNAREVGDLNTSYHSLISSGDSSKGDSSGILALAAGIDYCPRAAVLARVEVEQH